MRLSISEVVRLTNTISNSLARQNTFVSMMINNGDSIDVITQRGEMFTGVTLYHNGVAIAGDTIENHEGLNTLSTTHLIEALELTLNKQLS